MNLKFALLIMAAIVVVLIVLKSFGLLTVRSAVRLGFSGEEGLHTFNGSYSKIIGMMSRTLRPSKDSTTLHGEITTKSGTLHVTITDKANKTVLMDRDFSDDETFDIEANGNVVVKVTTKEHSGSYKFKY